MKSALVFAAALAAAWQCAALPCRAQTNAGTLYSLSSPPSEFEWGCFGPCECPVLIRTPLDGSFVLRPSHSDPFFTYYDVLDVRWKIPGDGGPVTIAGSGTYRRGGEVAVEEELALDLSFDGAPAQHFTSGLKPPGAVFPRIETRISLHQEYCHDSVLAVVAKPAAVTAAEGGSRATPIIATPNPFATATTIGFTMPHEGLATLRVFDLGGRRARTLLDRARLPEGPIARSWDGRGDDGLEAPPGLYLARLDTAVGRVTRILVKLR